MYSAHTGIYYVYMLSNSKRNLYIGVTNDLVRRVYEHKRKLVDGHSRKYNITWLVYYEETTDVMAALEREKQLKKWRRSKKEVLIESMNPKWKDLSRDWYDLGGRGL